MHYFNHTESQTVNDIHVTISTESNELTCSSESDVICLHFWTFLK